jgi:hypothetical protein
MKSEFVSDGVWKRITAAAKKTRKPALVAVAYFAQGASKLLPLRPNSRLVVDASEAAVKSGQTCPSDLKKLQKRGVAIYSYPNLHAKVYAFDGLVFIGSANVSNRSAGTLQEAVVRTMESQIVRSARRFVRDICLDELSPGRLDQLQRIYRPPRIPGGKIGMRTPTKRRSKLPRLFLAQLTMKTLPEGSETSNEQGMRIAKARRKHGRSYALDDYFREGKCIVQEGDKVVQILEDDGGHCLVDAPADVLYTRVWHGKRWDTTFIYLERPDVRRISLNKLAKRLGYGAKKRLSRDGLVRDRAFAEKLLGNWNQF